jgi:hypothetical protein
MQYVRALDLLAWARSLLPWGSVGVLNLLPSFQVPCALSVRHTGILKLVDMDRGPCMQSAIPECAAKMQLTVLQNCVLQLQPDVPVSTDGTFCNPSRGAQSRGELLIAADLHGCVCQQQQQCSGPKGKEEHLGLQVTLLKRAALC